MISSERYSVGSEDGRSISFQKEEGAFVGLDVTIKFKYVIVVIICAVWHMLTFMILEVFVKGLDILMKLKIEI